MGEPSHEQKSMKSQEKAEDPSDQAEILPRRFRNLTLLRRIARGGMGEVFLAAIGGIDGAERACVVKKIRPEHQEDKSFRARFLDETRVQAQLQHPGVAQILDAATGEDECPYAVVEYIEGRHLGEILARSNQLGVPIAWADAVAVGLCFADALAHVHERRDASGRPLAIAHRDLSPQNVMLGYAGDLKLIDFGTAKGENRRCRTVSGIVYAKPGYVAPEVANQTPGSAPADIYAMGVMIWEIISGRRFLQGDAVEHQAQVALGNRPLPALAKSVGAPTRLDQVLAKMTATEVSDRYASSRLAVADLVQLLKQAPSLADGTRSVRGRIAQLMQRLYPAEPARSRADFARRVAHSKKLAPSEQNASTRAGIPEPSPHTPEASPEGSDEQLLSGTRYRLIRNISRGTMGEVWEAHHVDLGRSVALKLMPEGASQSGQARKKFRSEARALARLKHPGLVDVFDFGVTARGRCYYGMELLEGETLEKRLQSGPLPQKLAIRFACDAAVALGVAHRAGIVHRDITPSNLFITTSGSLKLLDFGVSKTEEPAAEEAGDAPMVVGTPEYISPEQAAGGPANARSDIYSLGVVLHEMLTGKVPHPLGELGSPTLPALLTAKITVLPRAPSKVAPERNISASLDRAVLRMLTRDADRRIATTAQVLSMLRPLNDRRKNSSWRAPVVGLLSAAATFVVLLVSGFGLRGQFTAQASQPKTQRTALAASVESAENVASPSAPEDKAPRSPAPSKREADDALHPVAPPPGDAPDVAATQSIESEMAQKDPAYQQVQSILALSARGARINAHHKMKTLHAEYPESLSVARGLVSTARSVKAWGEAYDAAEYWMTHSDEAEAGVAFARLQRATLRGDAVETLKGVLESHPGYQPAVLLLEKYQKSERTAAR